jgi:hypothetical protein
VELMFGNRFILNRPAFPFLAAYGDVEEQRPTSTMGPSATPIVDSTAVFKGDIFKGKVLFCTGGGSGICRGMTEAVVSHSLVA